MEVDISIGILSHLEQHLLAFPVNSEDGAGGSPLLKQIFFFFFVHSALSVLQAVKETVLPGH